LLFRNWRLGFTCKRHKDCSQTRVLSLWEAIVLQTIADYPFSFTIDGKQVKDGLIRDTIGESVPPKVIDLLCKNIIKIEE
jgi:DNA (cytosine-5)-methyltransferase 1